MTSVSARLWSCTLTAFFKAPEKISSFHSIGIVKPISSDDSWPATGSNAVSSRQLAELGSHRSTNGSDQTSLGKLARCLSLIMFACTTIIGTGMRRALLICSRKLVESAADWETTASITSHARMTLEGLIGSFSDVDEIQRSNPRLGRGRRSVFSTNSRSASEWMT